MHVSTSAFKVRAMLATAFASLCFFAAPPSASAQRLPGNVRPTHYQIALNPELKTAAFSGKESIDIEVLRATDTIVLNAAEIAFQNVTITSGGQKQQAVPSLDKEKEQATLTFPRPISPGPATIDIAFTGILNNELRGFYLSKARGRNYAVTQFESTDARRAFPCFDEPALKATFDISLAVDDGDTAISNGPIASDSPGTPIPGKHTIRFATTPRMSTYLIAFLVGDFQCTSGDQDGVAIRVCSTPDKVALTPYSLEAARYFLHYYNNYFGIRYPLPKLDLIAIPDFEAGAMENFGAITYRETALLVDPQTASIGAEREVALTVAHEMAHQWFGDLVTMQWWDNIWLNEGFATWMESKAVAAMHPEWNMDQVIAADADRTLNIDAQPTTRAIRARADTPEEIEQMFDGIAYGKAGAVLSSVENYLGEETFRQGVHSYLSAHLYANATAEDFWNAQTATSHKPVDKIMESLVTQPGVPLLTFGMPGGGRVPIAQQRFFLSPSIRPDLAQKWSLPVCFKTEAGSPAQCDLLTPSQSSLSVPSGAFFFANANGRGYYRISYPPEIYTSLLAKVESALTPAERIAFLGDRWALVRANKTTIGSFLDLAAAVKDDPSPDVIESSLGGVYTAYDDFAATPAEKSAFSAWIRSTYAPQLARLGSPSASEAPGARELRAQLFTIVGLRGNDQAVLEQARQIAAKCLADPASVEPSLAHAAQYVAAIHGDSALFDTLQKIAETSTNPEFQSTALRLLAAFEDPALVQRSLEYAASGKVRSQDALRQIAAEMQSDVTRPQAWAFIKSHWDAIRALTTPEMGNSLVSSTGAFCSTAERDDVQAFFAAHQVSATRLSLRHALERINGCIEFRSLQQSNFDTWIASQPVR